jgi:hypothetical protein
LRNNVQLFGDALDCPEMNLYEKFEHRIVNAASLEEVADVLSDLLSGGYSVWSDGRLYEIRQLVEKVNGLRIEVLSREHAPPHFHVTGGGVDATFSVESGVFLVGRISRRERALVEWWFKRSRPVLVRAWNNSRPSDCTVGYVLE